MKVGAFWEAFGSHGARLARIWGLRPGRLRTGLGRGVGVRATIQTLRQRCLATLQHRFVLVSQVAGRSGALRARSVTLVVTPASGLCKHSWLRVPQFHTGNGGVS